jgi:BASS family bile acid:Na+ symporter
MNKYRSFIMPTAIVVGILLHHYLACAKGLVPYLIFIILLLAYSGLHFRRLRIRKENVIMLIFHVLLAIGGYCLCISFNKTVAQALLVGIICPVAASSSVIACMLGGDKEVSIAHTLIDNVMVAFVAPLLFTIVGTNQNLPFLTSMFMILLKITPIIILPLIIVIILKRFKPKVNEKIKKYEDYSLSIWALALMINFAQTTEYIFQFGKGNWHIIWILIFSSLVMCIIQFSLGKLIGMKSHQTISCGQGLGQKNTGLGIWMAYTYFSPLTSVYLCAYSLWQNGFNSLQLYLHDKKIKKKE